MGKTFRGNIREDAHDHTVTFDTGDLVKNKLINEFAGV